MPEAVHLQDPHKSFVNAQAQERVHEHEAGHQCDVACEHNRAAIHIDYPEDAPTNVVEQTGSHEKHQHGPGCGHVGFEAAALHIEKPHIHTENCGHLHHDKVQELIETAVPHEHGPGCGHVHHGAAHEHIDHHAVETKNDHGNRHGHHTHTHQHDQELRAVTQSIIEPEQIALQDAVERQAERQQAALYAELTAAAAQENKPLAPKSAETPPAKYPVREAVAPKPHIEHIPMPENAPSAENTPVADKRLLAPAALETGQLSDEAIVTDPVKVTKEHQSAAALTETTTDTETPAIIAQSPEAADHSPVHPTTVETATDEPMTTIVADTPVIETMSISSAAERPVAAETTSAFVKKAQALLSESLPADPSVTAQSAVEQLSPQDRVAGHVETAQKLSVITEAVVKIRRSTEALSPESLREELSSLIRIHAVSDKSLELLTLIESGTKTELLAMLERLFELTTAGRYRENSFFGQPSSDDTSVSAFASLGSTVLRLIGYYRQPFRSDVPLRLG